MTWNDPIVEEVRKVRDNIAAEHHYDIEAIGRYYQEKQKQARGKPVDRMNQRPNWRHTLNPVCRRMDVL